MITVIGLGFVGLTTALGFADKGFKVYGYEVNQQRRAALIDKKVPFHEPMLPDKLSEHLNENFILVEDLSEAITNSNVIFFCVGTPSDNDGYVDLSYLENSINQVLDVADKNFRVLCVKSTVPPSTTKKDVKAFVRAKGWEPGKDIGIANNPEFLREGFAWYDFIEADRIVIGVEDSHSQEILNELYIPFQAPIHFVSLNTGEFIKYLSNTLLATMISFSNELSMIGHSIGGVDIAQAFHILHEDKRWFGSPAKMCSYVFPGCGFGGYCLPKDTSGLVGKSREYGYNAEILRSVLSVNDTVRGFLMRMLYKTVSKDSVIAILGLSFKPGSDDVRMTPAAGVVKDLIDNGYGSIVAYDPLACTIFQESYDFDITYAERLEDAVKDAGAVVIATAWPEFINKSNLFKNKLLFDLRYCIS